MRTDVDDSADLAAVVALGVGPRTAAALGLRAEYVGGVQATVASYDDGHGRVVLDDGTRLPFSPAALRGSGIRLLHPGQRVSVHAEGGVVQRLWLPGLGEAPG